MLVTAPVSESEEAGAAGHNRHNMSTAPLTNQLTDDEQAALERLLHLASRADSKETAIFFDKESRETLRQIENKL